MSYTCHDCELQLTSFTAGELSAADRALVTAHLAVCEACQAELERENELRQLLQSVPPAVCPERVTALLPTVAASSDRALPRRWLTAVALTAAVLLAAVLIPASPRQPTTRGKPTTVGARSYTAAEVDQARRDVVATLVMAASVLERSRERTVSDVFGRRLPRAVAGSLSSHESTSENSNSTPNTISPGGQG